MFARLLAPIGLVAVLAACTPWQHGQRMPTTAAANVRPAAHARPQIDPKTAVANGFRALANSFRRISGAEASAAVAHGFAVVEEADPTVASVPDPKVLESQAEIVRGGGHYQVGQPYEVAGKLYEPHADPSYDRSGTASWYGPSFHGRLTANGEIFDSSAISAAHPTMPLPSYVRVTNLVNGRSIVVRVNDRGPYSGDRLIDVSERTAALLGFRRRGTTQVRVQYISPAPLEGEDKSKLLATYEGPPQQAPRVILASAPTAPAAPAADDAVAYAAPPEPRPAAIAAMQKLTEPMPTADRILMAFQAAGNGER